MKHLLLLGCVLWTSVVLAQTPKPPYTSSKFEQLGEELPTPNNYRTASGAPGHEYWQQKANYKIKATLSEETQTITGTETVTYINNSPDELRYLWVQLDQNHFDKNSDAPLTESAKIGANPSFPLLQLAVATNSEGGYKISNVRDNAGKPLKYVINKTMMRIDLPAPIKPKGGSYTFALDWSFKIVDETKTNARSGYEFFAKDGNYVYQIAQWFPRMAVYYDVYGWQHKQFLGRGEFALTFGDYEVDITVPADHILGATGVLQNPTEVLTPTQMQRFKQAETATDPVVIVTQAEAEAAEKTKAKGTKIWKFKAQNVRDYAFVTSRKYIWDAMGVDMNGKKVMAMSFYPKEANPLWGKYSTRVVAHTIKTYSKYTFDYPYPVAISTNGGQFGMEYPMISFNGGRPEEDGTINPQTRNSMIYVIIHEVGHNYFPMIVNSDERQWTWMDEGINSFVQYLAEVELEGLPWVKEDYPGKFPSSGGTSPTIIPYMKGDPTKLVPIMTNSEQIANNQFGPNAYNKPATGLNLLRESVMGRELFDYAFKEYSRRWMFKHPAPADFFRTMEDASGVDLDWFWRGWFYGTEAYDVAIENVEAFRMPPADGSPIVSADSPFKGTPFNKQGFDGMMGQFGYYLSETEKNTFSSNNYFYAVNFKNVGGLLLPVIVEMTYKDGSKEIVKIPAEVWRLNPLEANKVFVTTKELSAIRLDPNKELPDIDNNNDTFPRKDAPNKFDELKEDKKAGEKEEVKEEVKKEEPKPEEPKEKKKKKKSN
jgi:hypothetical protein